MTQIAKHTFALAVALLITAVTFSHAVGFPAAQTGPAIAGRVLV